MKNLYSIRAAAKLCGCSIRQFYRIIDEAGVEKLNFGHGNLKRFFIRAADVEKLKRKK